MNKTALLFLFIWSWSVSKGYSQNALAQKGIITTATNEKISFNNLRLVNGKFVYLDVASASEKELAINDTKYIEGGQQSKVFTNKAVVERTKEEDLQREAVQKAKAIEEATQRDIAYRKKVEAEKIRPAYDLYPVGVYATKTDFLNKKPSNSEALVAKEVTDMDKETYYGIPDECFFYYVQSDKKVKNSFAVSYRGHLYFMIDAILNNRNKTDRAQSNDHPNSFVRTKIHGDNYYYLEADLANFWAQGASVGAFGIIIGSAVADSMNNVKGIVWDIKNKEFNIFKNCKDYNAFIKDLYPSGVQECKNQQPDIKLVRTAIDKIK